MRRSNVILALALTALAVTFFTAAANAYVPRYSPSEIAVDNDGNVYTIMNMDSSTGEGIFSYATNGTEIYSVLRPRCSDIAIDDHGIVYVLNIAKKQVERMEKNGTFSVLWREDNPDHFINYFTTDHYDNILVSDFNYSQAEIKVTDGYIMKISPQGRVTDVIEGSPAVPLNKTFKMTVGVNGTIYLTELNRSIMAIYPDGNRSTITCTSPDNDSFGQMIDVEAGDDGYLYVGEMSEGRVRKLTTDGTQVARWDGCGPERFNTPVSIVPCRDGRVYVSDTLNQRIVWFDSNRYSFGSDTTANLAGKGVLWDNIIAGDNYTVAHKDGLYGGGALQGTPGFGLAIVLAGLFIAGAVLCSRRVRK